jgi:DNA-binding MarR family transcriptional regulator
MPHRALADRLHSATIHLLRKLRVTDAETGLTAPRASALSVLVFGGPRTLGALATAEQVRPPTMTRLVRDMERDGLVTRRGDADDRRVQWIHPTPRGRKLLEQGRARRVGALEAAIGRLTPSDRRVLAEALPLIEQLARP